MKLLLSFTDKLGKVDGAAAQLRCRPMEVMLNLVD
jgi:hypothetical protein